MRQEEAHAQSRGCTFVVGVCAGICVGARAYASVCGEDGRRRYRHGLDAELANFSSRAPVAREVVVHLHRQGTVAQVNLNSGAATRGAVADGGEVPLRWVESVFCHAHGHARACSCEHSELYHKC